MTKAEEMEKLTRESSYKKYEYAIDKALQFIKSNALQGLNYCTLEYTEIPEAENSSFRLWFVAEGFHFTNYSIDSITINW